MTDVYNKAALTREHFAGANADVDIHIEAYEGDIDGSFRVGSIFRSMGLTNFKSVGNNSNTWRGDRIGAAVVQGRKSGVQLDGARIANDKFIVTVDTTSYIRTPFDYQDDWTAPDFQAEYSAEHGSAHAKSFDQAHIIQLIKCSAFVAPAHLVPAFSNGIAVTMTGYAAAAATATLTVGEVKADMIVQAHKNALTTFVKRDLGDSLADTMTLITPDEFNILLEHKKLMNVDFQGGNADNSFTARRIAWLNGVRVMETPRIPTAAIPAHILGESFNLTAAEAKARVIIFFPKKALVTVEAKGMTVRHWDDPEHFQSVLDSYNMYTVGQRRPDAVAVLFTD
jgi:hypothetical protein